MRERYVFLRLSFEPTENYNRFRLAGAFRFFGAAFFAVFRFFAAMLFYGSIWFAIRPHYFLC
jgi:hypothetical protein